MNFWLIEGNPEKSGRLFQCIAKRQILENKSTHLKDPDYRTVNLKKVFKEDKSHTNFGSL